MDDGERARQVGVGAVARAEGSDILVILDELEERVGAVGRIERERSFYDLHPAEVARELGLLAVHVCDDVLLDEDEHGKAHTVGLLVELVGKVLVARC